MHPSQEQAVVELLKRVYQEESIGYPFEAPNFDEQAANWSAKILFYSAQLVMYREHDSDSLVEVVKPFEFEVTASAVITADLCLRFVPALIQYLEQIDVEDELIPLLNDLLTKWHYTGLLSGIEIENPSYTEAYTHPCIQQLYVDRIIEQKKVKIASMSLMKSHVQNALGNYNELFWKDFKAKI